MSSISPAYLNKNPARLAMLPYWFDSNVTKPLANLLTKPSVFYSFCHLYLVIFFQWKLLLLLLLLIISSTRLFLTIP